MPGQRCSRTTGRRALAAACLVAAALAFGAPPAQAAPAVTVTPATGLTAGQQVTVSFTGFTPNKTITVRQCNPEPESGDDCDFLSLQQPVTDGTGAGSIQFPALILPNDALPGPVECDADTPCVITVADDLNDLTQSNASMAISFGSGAGTIVTTTVPAVTTTTVGATTTTAAGGTTSTTTGGGTTTTTSGSGTTTTTAASSGSTTSTTGAGSTTTSSVAGTTGGSSTTLAPGSLNVPLDDSFGTLSLTGSSAVLPFLALLGVAATVGGSVVRSTLARPRRRVAGWARGRRAPW